MSIPMTQTTTPVRKLWKSIAAILLGFVAIFVLSLGTDQVFHVLAVYPPWDQPMPDPLHNLLALSYRIVYDTFGCYLAARFAPRHPMRHALILGGIGFVLSTFGAIVTIPMNFGPAWYPILLALSSVPCAWLGGFLYLRRHQAR